MRAQMFDHVTSLLSKYGEYSEAEFSTHVSQLLSSKANLTEALGVSAEFGGMMQATYEELMDSKVFELNSGGLRLADLAMILIAVAVISLEVCCLTYWKNRSYYNEKAKRFGKKTRKFFAKKLWDMKFGKGSGDDLQLCMDQFSSKGASLMKAAGLKPSELRAQLHQAKSSPRLQVRNLRAAFAAFMAHHGATIAEHGLDHLGLGSCGKIFCAGDLRFALDESGLYRCDWQCPASYLPDTFHAINMSMKNTFQGLEDAAQSQPKLMEELEEEKVDDNKIQSELRTMTKGVNVVEMNAYYSNPWSPEGLQIMKMPNASTFSSMKPFTSLYYRGTCIPEQKYFKKHDVAIVSTSEINIPKGTVVKLDRVEMKGTTRATGTAFSTWRGKEKKLWLEDISFGLIPVEMDAAGWLAATNQSLPSNPLQLQDPSDPSKVYVLPE